MFQIPLLAVANQTVAVLLGGDQYQLLVQEAGGMMVMSLARNGTVLMSCGRCLAGQFATPYLHLREGFGAFFWATEGDAMPWYEQFGTTHFLNYVTQAELDAA